MSLFRCICITLFILNSCFAYCLVNRNYKAHWLWKLSIGILILLSINTLSSLFGFYLCGNNVNRIGFVIANVLFLLGGGLVLKLQKENKTIIEKNNIFWAASLCMIIFFALFLSTGEELLPIWGNVDDVVHFEIVASFYNNLNLESPLPYLGLEPLEMRISEFSYVWAYHYNCAFISYILNIDIFYVMHFFRCFYVAVISACPFLLLQEKSLLAKIVCGLLCIFSWENWYVLLNSGYSPNLFALFFCFFLVGILKNIENYRIPDTDLKLLLPLAGLVALVGYLPVGVFFLVFLIFYYLQQKRRSDIFRLFAAVIFFLPQPVIWNQLVAVFQTGATSVVALHDNKWLKDTPSILWAGLTFLIVGIALYKKRFWDSWLIMILLTICVCLIISPTSYMTFKFILQARLLLIPVICDIVVSVMRQPSKKYIKVIGFLCIFLPCVWIMNKTEILPISIKLFPVINAKQQITAGQLNCLDYVNDKYGGEVKIEYLGWDGPTAFIGQKITGEVPYSYLPNDNGWRFRGGCSAQDYISSVLKKQLQNENNERTILLVNTENVRDFQILYEYPFLFKSLKSQIWELSINNGITIDYLSPNDFAKNEQCIKKQISGYGECIILAEKEKCTLLNVKLNEQCDIGYLVLKGRVINKSSFLIRFMKDGECVYEEEIPEFSGWYILDIGDILDCDELQIESTSRVYSDSVIIGELYYGADL